MNQMLLLLKSARFLHRMSGAEWRLKNGNLATQLRTRMFFIHEPDKLDIHVACTFNKNL